MEASIGCVIAVDCGDFGYYQGKLSAIHAEDEVKGITLANPFKDGIPCGKQLRLDADKINKLIVLKVAHSETSIEEPPTQQTQNYQKVKGLQRNRSTSAATALKPSNSGHNNAKWVSRPIPSHLRKMQIESGCSSDDESSSQVSRSEIRKTKGAKPRKGKGHSASVADCESEVTATPTPMFKRFEPQVPKPQQLCAPAWAIKSSKKGKGPCGIPILDVQNGYGPIGTKDAHLDKPIDFDLLATDFDFTTNFKEFDRDNVEPEDQEFFDTVEKPKMSQNFAHNENILSDPTRITSWTNVTSKNCYSSSESVESHEPVSPLLMSFCPSAFEHLANGVRAPVLDKVIKQKYLKTCRSHLGSSGFSFAIADRLLMFACQVSSKILKTACPHTVILSDYDHSKCSAILASRLHDRGHNVSVYGAFDGISNCNINKILSTKQLPTKPELVIVLSESCGQDVEEWLKRCSEAHVFAVESRPSVADNSKLHILMLGTITADLCNAPAQLTVGRTSFAELAGVTQPIATKIDGRVADIGVPFSWIVDGNKKDFAAAFANGPLASF